MQYQKIQIDANIWVILENGKDYKKPIRDNFRTFAFDTETIVYLDGIKQKPKDLYEKLKGLDMDEIRKRVTNLTWAYQVYDEINGFFMTNDFLTFCDYVARCGLKYGWCYNATFDFSQIDYQILSNPLWKPHEKGRNTRGQKYTFSSLHNSTGARYCYKLWIPYKNASSHHYTASFEIRDFMKLVVGGLKNLLIDLDVQDNDGKPIRKLEMGYQDVDPNNLTENEINYCCNDVKGLYFAVKKFDLTLLEQSNNESRVFGADTNIMTSGGFAKRELLRSLYPNVERQYRLKEFQKDHPINLKQDEYIRKNYLYRGGLTFLNPNYKGKLITNRIMYRYDVNSEYPYCMTMINDLVGVPFRKTLKQYEKMKNKDDYECIYILNSVYGHVKKNMLGVWYNPFTREFEDNIMEEQTHLMFKREIDELDNWYDLELDVKEVILIKKSSHAYATFINESYKVKAEAKKNHNKTLEKTTKIKLNSSYGKLAERCEREKGHYEINEETGAVHFVSDGVEVDAKGIMNVIIGSLITCYARCYILSKIREICPNPSKDFVYIDTDSIHCFCEYKKADAYTLGGLKLEATCEAIKYIAPKTYVDIEKINADGSIDLNNVEIHSKGISVNVIFTELMKKDKVFIKDINDAIAYGKEYTILCAMNVKGGKVLLPLDKFIARMELAPKEFCTNDNNSVYLIER